MLLGETITRKNSGNEVLENPLDKMSTQTLNTPPPQKSVKAQVFGLLKKTLTHHLSLHGNYKQGANYLNLSSNCPQLAVILASKYCKINLCDKRQKL